MGETEWPENPAIVVAPPWHDFVRLWLVCRGEAGLAHWPDPGGVAHQAAWIIDAMLTLASASAEFDKLDRERRGQ